MLLAEMFGREVAKRSISCPIASPRFFHTFLHLKAVQAFIRRGKVEGKRGLWRAAGVWLSHGPAIRSTTHCSVRLDQQAWVHRLDVTIFVFRSSWTGISSVVKQWKKWLLASSYIKIRTICTVIDSLMKTRWPFCFNLDRILFLSRVMAVSSRCQIWGPAMASVAAIS
jgi:hypothetical protein